MALSIQKLPQIPADERIRYPALTKAEKISMLNMLPNNDHIQFIMVGSDKDDPVFYSLDTASLRFLDLDGDNKLDLLYSGQSGWNNTRDSKLYYQEQEQLIFNNIIYGSLFHVGISNNGFELFTISVPCCDSYTTSILKYTLTTDRKLLLQQSISFIGIPYTSRSPDLDEYLELNGASYLNKMPDFSHGQKGVIKDAALYASADDFRNISPYFRERTKAIKDSLRMGHFIELIRLKGKTDVTVLDQRPVRDQNWYLVITDPVNNAPRSLYDGPEDNKRRFVGWVKEVDLK